MKHIVIALTTLCLALAAPLSSYAGNAPAWHMGSFSKKATLSTCISFAKAALADENCQILTQDSNTVIAGNDSVVVQVSCSPQAGGAIWVVVSAYSTNSSLAEAARNKVREHIVKTGLIDPGSAGVPARN